MKRSFPFGYTLPFTDQKVNMHSGADVLSSQVSDSSMNELGPNSFHLGDTKFAVVSCFKGIIRVHIRHYYRDQQGVLQPSREGVSLLPKVWKAFYEAIPSFRSKNASDVIIVSKSLLLSKEIRGNEKCVSFQNMFQKKDCAFQLTATRILLSVKQLDRLEAVSEEITEAINEGFVNESLDYFVKEEFVKRGAGTDEKYYGDPDRSEKVSELTDRVAKHLKVLISEKIKKMMNCFGCENNFENQLGHECMTMSLSERYDRYFLNALYEIDWNRFGETLTSENMSLRTCPFHQMIKKLI